MRISYLMPDLGFTGGSQVLYNFMERLAARDHEVYLITPGGSVRWLPGTAEAVNARRVGAGSGGAGPSDALQFDGVDEVAEDILGGRPGPLTASTIVASALTEGLMRHWVPSDVTVATHNFTALAAFYLMDRTLPFYHIQAYEEPFSGNSYLRKMARLSYFLPLRQMANSTWLGNRLKTLTGRGCALVFPGIDTAVFRPLPGSQTKYTGPSGEIKVLTCYSPAPHKGWAEAAAAMRMASARLNGRLTWVVFGCRPEPVEGVRVDYRGRVFGHELARLYCECHICLVPSWFESFPLPQLEAMACGTAVISTPSGAEDYLFPGKNALSAPPGDPAAISGAIVNLAQSRELCRSLVEAGLRTAPMFAWDKAVKQLEMVFADGVAARGENKFERLMAELTVPGRSGRK